MVTEAATPSAWERALVRALANGVQVRRVSKTRHGYDGTLRYEATSVSRPGTIHRVAIHTSAAGVEVVCGCTAGQRGQVCQHAAGALKAAGLFGGGEPATVPQPDPEPEPPVALSRGREALRRMWDLEPGDDSTPWLHGAA